jgi:hypothetical protein
MCQLIGELAPTRKLEGKTRRKGKAKINDKGEGSSDLPPPKMKPFWKMKKWFEFEDDFRWVMIVGFGALWRLHWAPIREDLVYDFLKGIKSVDEMQIKVVVRG